MSSALASTRAPTRTERQTSASPMASLGSRHDDRAARIAGGEDISRPDGGRSTEALTHNMIDAGAPARHGERGSPQPKKGKESVRGANGAIVGTMSAGPRFLTLPDVAEILNTSLAQVTALVRRGELRALKLGGRGQWRVETSELEAFIERMYVETEQQLRPPAGRAASGTAEEVSDEVSDEAPRGH